MSRFLKYATLLIVVLVALSNSSDPPNGRTGAPSDGACSDCHSGNNFDGNVVISGLPDEVESGATYSLTVTTTNTDGNAVRSGFQLVSLFNDDFTSAGELMKDSDDEGISVAGGRRYVEHRGPKNFQDDVAEWIFDWEAPIVDEDREVVMFTASVIGNGSGSSGDAVKFTDMATIVRVMEDSLEVSIEVQDVLCNGELGSLTANVTGGTEPYAYEWSNGVLTAENADVQAGFYSVTVTDADANSAVTEITLVEPDNFVFDLVVNDESAEGAADGVIQSNLSGGTAPYEYLWSNGETTADISGLAEGTYSLSVTDANTCTDSVRVNVGGVGCSFSVNLTSSNITCTGEADGEAFIEPDGFVPPLEFEWSNGDASFIAIAGLEAGAYAVTVTDSTGCTIVEEFQIVEPAPIMVETEFITPDCENAAENSLNATVSGGTGSYSYLWSNDETTPSIANIEEGLYSVTVTDSLGCSAASDTISISFADTEAPRITFTDSVSLFVDAAGELDLTPLNLMETDNCSIASTELSGDTSCDNLVSRTLTYEATDLSGNIGSVDIFITSVIDTIAPTAACIDDIIQNGCDTVFYELPAFMDNCSVDSIELAEGLPSGSIFPKDSTKVTYNAYDAAGNFVCCSFWVVTTNDLELTIDSVADATTTTGGSIDISISGGSGTYTYEWTLNDTLVVSSFEDVSNLEPGVYIVKVMDEIGCTLVSDAILIEMSSSFSEEVLPEAKLFPNPTHNVLNVESEEDVLNARIINLQGQVIAAPYAVRNTRNMTLNTSSLESGLYFIQLEFEGGWKSVKFTKL